ncbi:MAG: phenazine biosynthesis protein PhzF [Rhodospirillales bacterium]|nr:phenazine biosynthesis protein PhzF [Rhodospirillales bacterium]
MTHRFIIADVFTDRAFGGNQLAVFPDGKGIPDALMQSYAHELNFSETTFVLPPRKPGHTHRVRIFTPHEELPFAGHPNIGTAIVLATLGKQAGRGGTARFVFDEDVGTVSVSADIASDRSYAELTLDGGAEIRECGIPRAALARVVSLPEDRIGPRTPWMAGIGIRFCCIPVTDFSSVATAKLDVFAWEQIFPATAWARQIYAIAGDFTPGAKLKVRMWGPSVGVAEDPATGSAAAVLAASLAAALPDRDGHFTWTIEQGAELARPSFISASAEKRDGQVISTRVGGGAVIVGEGSFN